MSLETYRRKRHFDQTTDEILEQLPASVKTGRDMQQIAAGSKPITPAAKRPKSEAQAKPHASEGNGRVKPAKTKTSALAQIPGARRGELPRIFQPQLATLAQHPPEGDQWWHETKFDGYRMALRIQDGTIEILSRRMQTWTKRLPHLVDAAKKLAVRSALLDGELVAWQSNGATSFQALQSAFKENRATELVYCAFDLLYLDGYDLRPASLETRKEWLAELLQPGSETQGPIRYTEHALGAGPQCFEKACREGKEGIISKRRDAPYVAGHGGNWLKAKCLKQQELVIGGYTEPEGTRTDFGALLLGYYAGRNLVYAGRAGTGFNDRTLAELGKQLKGLRQAKSPFSRPPDLRGKARAVHWVRPELVAQIRFSEWTMDGILRQPSFQGLREDKNPHEVVREELGDNSLLTQNPPSPQETAAKGGVASDAGNRGGEKPAADIHLASLGIRFTHPDKILYQDQGITKYELAKYYADIAAWIVPHIAGRPLTLVRCPDGAQCECFFQKHSAQGNLAHLRSIPISESGKTANYVIADDPAGLLSLVQMGVLEIHVWGSRADGLERPDRLVFDLDPDPSVPWSRVVESAVQLKQFFDNLGLQSFPKTTGGKGLHIVVPILRRHEWPEVAEFCRSVAEAVAHADPQRYTSQSSKAARKGKIFFDYLRNHRGATSVAPYSTRSRPGAPVAVPLSWKEVTPALRSDQFNIRNVRERLARLARDPWLGIQDVRQAITSAARTKLQYQ